MIGNDEFQNIREELNGKDPLIKRVKLRDIKLDDRSIDRGIIILNGHEVPVTKSFFNRLGQVVSLNVALLNRMQKNQDKEVQIKLLESVKAYAETRDGEKDFFLIGDPNLHKITNIVLADRYSRLTNETLFQTTEILMNEIPDLTIESIDQDSGNLSINLVHTHQQGFDRLGPDEIFRFGVSLVNTQNSSQIKDFMYRMSCSNGMISRDDSDGPGGKFGGSGGSGPEAFRDIINQAHIWSRDGFIPVSFQDKLERAMNTQASFEEMHRTYEIVKNQIVEEDIDRKLVLQQAVKAQLFPHLLETERRIINKGFDPTILSAEQRKFIKTGHTVWDLINDLTWLGSHQSIFDLSNSKALKVEGGRLFVKKWDLEHSMLASI